MQESLQNSENGLSSPIKFLKPIHWVKSSAQWYVFQRMNSWCQLWQVGKVWWEWYVFQRMKIVQICLLNEWILEQFLKQSAFCNFFFVSYIDQIYYRYRNSNWKKQSEYRNMQEKLENRISNLKITVLRFKPKLYIPSTLNIALLQWHTHLNVCAVK